MSTKTAPREAFKIEPRLVAGDPTKRMNHVIAQCRYCPGEDAIPITTHKPTIPVEFAKRMFRKRGWGIGAHRGKDSCPTCHGYAKADSAPMEKRSEVLLDATMHVLANGLVPIEINPEDPTVADKPKDANDYVVPEGVIDVLKKAGDINPDMVSKVVNGAVARRASQDGQRLRDYNNSLTHEQRSEITKKGHATRKAKKEAKIAEQREKKGAGSRRYWASMTPEERSQRQKDAAAVRLGRKPPASAFKPLPLKPEIESLPQETVADPKPPRAATPAENRRIIEALDTHYNTLKQCYIGAWTDKKVADELNLPWAWVAEMRERVYGPERNEAAEVAGAELKKHWETLGKLETDVLTAFDKFDEQIKAQRAALLKTAEKIGVVLA
uniref:Modular polyketide synthase n=1 Tax=Caulobacter phage BL57 TaxID=3348355 RepID=A0AB74UMI7_9VIRU